jgi:4-diphosphocytidyl-2-C-methyl-D-erythritol kinase
VIKPPTGLETAQIFRDPRLNRATKPATISVFAADPYDFGHNDLQPVAESLCPDIAQARECMAQAGMKARMTGSGSAVFALCQAPGQSKQVQVPESWLLQECSNMEVHPLVGWASSDN